MSLGPIQTIKLHHFSLGSSDLGQFLGILLLMTMTVLKSTGQIFCKMSLNWGSCGVFLMVTLCLWVWGGQHHRCKVPFSTDHIEGTCYQHDNMDDVKSDNLAKIMFNRFLWYKVTFFLSRLYYNGSQSLSIAHI